MMEIRMRKDAIDAPTYRSQLRHRRLLDWNSVIKRDTSLIMWLSCFMVINKHTCLENICCYWVDKRHRPACGVYNRSRGTLWAFCVPHTGISIDRWPSSVCMSRVSTVSAAALPAHSIPCKTVANAHISRRPRPGPQAWSILALHSRDLAWSSAVYIAVQPVCCPFPPAVHRASDRNPVQEGKVILNELNHFIYFIYDIPSILCLVGSYAILSSRQPSSCFTLPRP